MDSCKFQKEDEIYKQRTRSSKVRCRLKFVVPQYSMIGGGKINLKKSNKNDQENLQRSRQKNLENLTFLKSVFHTPLKNSNQDTSLSTSYTKISKYYYKFTLQPSSDYEFIDSI